MKRNKLNSEQISALCMELSLLVHAGVGVGDGLSLLAEEADCLEDRAMLTRMAGQVDEGASLAAALRSSGCFPDYVASLAEVGQRSGHMEEALTALADYYDGRCRMEHRLRSALLYPAVLLLLMLAVLAVLLTKVLPVFNDGYASLGGQLTGVAGGLLALGQMLDTALPWLCALLTLVAAATAAFAASPALREKPLGLWRRLWGDRGLARQLQTARFAQALAMGLRSGMPLEEALTLAGGLRDNTPAANARCGDCLARLEQGEELSGALSASGVMPAAACRMLALGQRSGAGDTAMEEVARRLDQESAEALERKVGQVEPALVLATSLLVGVILLSVMLPLLRIMTAIG